MAAAEDMPDATGGGDAHMGVEQQKQLSRLLQFLSNESEHGAQSNEPDWSFDDEACDSQSNQ